MPVVFTNPQFSYQVGSNPANQSYSTQLNLRQMMGELTRWNQNLDPTDAARIINNRYRQVVRRREWYGLKVRGVASVPAVTQNGLVTVTQGSQTVTGTSTTFTTALIGQQFRTSFIQDFQTITAVNVGTQTLTLDTPYPGTSGSSGYMITQTYLTFGANIDRFEWAKNQLFGWPMEVNVPVEVINFKDTWRQQLGWATVFATRAPTPDGQFQVECWPSPFSPQIFPFEAWTQPADMVLDTDCPVAWISSDIIVTGGIADALMHNPRKNPGFSEQACIQVAGEKEKQFQRDLAEAENKDEGLSQQAVSWDFGQEDGPVGIGTGSTWSQMHE